MSTNIEQSHGQMTTLTSSEHERVVREFNDTAAAYDKNRLLHELFEDQVLRTPNASAVVHDDQVITYRDLNERANRLARYLVQRGVVSDTLVGICVGRSFEMIIAVLAVIKAGGAYLPLDPNYPAERLRYMLEDAGPLLVLIQNDLSSLVPVTSSQAIILETVLNDVAGFVAENLQAAKLNLTPEDLVYVIYTSGSTGRPKGIAMGHRSMVNLIEWHRTCLIANECQRVLQFAALSFDVAFQETFSTLCSGATLVLVDERTRRDVRALAELLRAKAIERLFVPPLILQSLAEYYQSTDEVPMALKEVIVAGEQLHISSEIRTLFNSIQGCALHNHYGPTETHVVTSVTLAGAPESWPSLPSIGRPIANTQIYILDDRKQVVPVGITGEIYIGGAGVSRGYLNRPELTAERFIANPFAANRNSRLYQTGDLARWCLDGSIEYLGRNDQQIKLRGFRIEIGEIEAQLLRHQRVKEVVVIVREDAPGSKRLVAYIIWSDRATAGSAPRADELRAHLLASLPEYMVPSAFVVLERFPLTPNGKMDRMALPAPGLDAFASRPYEAPRSAVEQILVDIWQELLGVSRVGRRDNLFELGGNSLLIVKMMARLRRMGWAAEVSHYFNSADLADLAGKLSDETGRSFEAPPNLIPPGCRIITPQMLPLVKLDVDQIEKITTVVPGGTENIQDIYPLAPLQEGIHFHSLLNRCGSDAYVRTILLSISSNERLIQLQDALQAVIDRHDMLRTAILWEHLPKPVQVVLRHARLNIEHLHLESDRDTVEHLTETMLDGHLRLDPTHAPLIRLRVTHSDAGVQYALLDTHHLVCDNESLEIILAEVRAILDNHLNELPEPTSYREHVAQAMSPTLVNDAEGFFRRKLDGISEPTSPFGLLDVHADGNHAEEHRHELGTSLAWRIRAQARRLGVSTATLFHAAWSLVVACSSGRDDVVFGTVLLGRLQGSAGAKQIVGMFINTLPLRIVLRDCSVLELVRQTQRELTELLSHEQTSLSVAQRGSEIGGSAPLFTSLFNYLHSESNLTDETPHIAAGIKMLAFRERTNYPIALSVEDRGEGFVLSAQTDRRVSPSRITSYLSRAMHSLIDALESEADTPALELVVLPESEQNLVLESFSSNSTTRSRETLASHMFEQQVLRTPEAVAVVCGNRQITYADLNYRANQLARTLKSYGVRPDDRVGLFTERSIEMVVGMLGVLKAGGAYVPLDVNYPPERLAYIIRDSAPIALLTSETSKLTLPDADSSIIALAGIETEQESGCNLELGESEAKPRNLAYVIYTSGSTGTPKGVMVEHHNLVNLIDWHCAAFALNEGCRCSSVAAVGFDAAVWEIWPPLTAGATVVLASAEVFGDPQALLAWWAGERLDVSFLPTPLAELAFSQNINNPGLRTLLVGGDRLRHRPPVLSGSLINNYGPTESTVVATSGPITADDSVFHIGRPIANARIYILNSHLKPVPVGVSGEIYIGGQGVARGYLNRPELTAERFQRDPFSAGSGGRMYRSGDLAKWREDGTIEFLGRNDDQVKIRGYRIELGEIELQLLRNEKVTNAVVVAHEELMGERRLVAYLTSPELSPASVDELVGQLKRSLPEYMVPKEFIVLDNLPLTVNGKIDRRALPLPQPGGHTRRQFAPLQGETEEAMGRVWKELLGIDQIGRDDDFFDLGGHSLLAMQLAVRIQTSFSIDMQMNSLFQFRTIKELSRYIDDLRQQRLWDTISGKQDDIDELIQKVASMADSQVQELVRKLNVGGTP